MSSIVIIVVLIAIAVVFVVVKRKHPKGEAQFPYEQKKTFFTPAERSFYTVLKQTVADKYDIFGQVRVADLLVVKAGLGRSERQGFFNKIKAKHVDFLLCSPEDLSVIAAIELDDKSHQKTQRMRRDEFLDSAFAEAGLPLIRFRVREAYTVQDITIGLEAALQVEPEKQQEYDSTLVDVGIPSSTVTQPEESVFLQEETYEKQVEPGVIEIHLEPLTAYESQHIEELEPKDKILCPKCASIMIIRKADKGKRAGKYFLTCSTYPVCKRAVPFEEL